MRPTIETYCEGDRADCLAIFDGNLPKFFAPEERDEFSDYLDRVERDEHPYLTVRQGEAMVACGGLWIDAQRREARLAWGMVARDLHGRGIGRMLTEARLALARETPGVERVGLETSQHTFGFYEKFGFRTTKITPNGFGAGLDCYAMTLDAG